MDTTAHRRAWMDNAVQGDGQHLPPSPLRPLPRPRHHAPPPYTTAGTSQHVAVKSTTQWQTRGSELVAPFIIDHTSFAYRLYSNVVRERATLYVGMSVRPSVRPGPTAGAASPIDLKIVGGHPSSLSIDVILPKPSLRHTYLHRPSSQNPVTSSPLFTTRCCLLSW